MRRAILTLAALLAGFLTGVALALRGKPVHECFAERIIPRPELGFADTEWLGIDEALR